MGNLNKTCRLGIILTTLLSATFAASVQAEDQNDVIYQKNYGEKWAFTIDRAIITCDNQAAFLIDPATHITYPLNGLAKTRSEASGKTAGNIDDIWKDRPYFKGVKIDISPFIDKALELCE
ncbi:DUF2511 domain-containing protein [Rahnella aceris]